MSIIYGSLFLSLLRWLYFHRKKKKKRINNWGLKGLTSGHIHKSVYTNYLLENNLRDPSKRLDQSARIKIMTTLKSGGRYLKKKWSRPKGHYSSPAQGHHHKYVLIHWRFVFWPPPLPLLSRTLRRRETPFGGRLASSPLIHSSWLGLDFTSNGTFDPIDTPHSAAIAAEAPTVMRPKERALGRCFHRLGYYLLSI